MDGYELNKMKKILIKTAASFVFGFLTMLSFNTKASSISAEGDPIAELKGKLRQIDSQTYECRHRRRGVCGYVVLDPTGGTNYLFQFPSDFQGPFPVGAYKNAQNMWVVPYTSITEGVDSDDSFTLIQF